MNENWDSEHEDNLEIVKWRENKVGTLNVLCFTFLISNFGGKTSLCLYFFQLPAP